MSINHNPVPIVLVLGLLSMAAFVGPCPSSITEEDLTVEEVKDHLTYLASDELEGRKTGTPGNEKAARYIASRFEEAGLQSLPAMDGYFQQIAFERFPAVSAGHLSIGEKRFELGQDLVLLDGDRLQTEAEVVFLEDFAGQSSQAEVEGKIVVTRFEGAKPGESPRRWIELSDQRRAALSQRGAVALVEIYSDRRWLWLKRFFGTERISLAQEDQSRAHVSMPGLVIGDPEGELLPYFRVRRKFRASIDTPQRNAESLQSPNVIGWAQGSDPLLRDEYVLVTAHFDHLGVNPNSSRATADDAIFNGARDNGFGTTAVLAAARGLAGNPPKRSVVFIAFTAEEIGLLGSRYYVENPAVPLEKTVFVLNTDGAGFTDTSAATVLGIERISSGDDIRAACNDFGLEALEAANPLKGLFRQSDNFAFASRGIPAPTFSPGFRAFDEEIRKFYHQPGDEVDEGFDFAYLLRFSQAFARTARRVADNPTLPRWVPGDPLEDRWHSLFDAGNHQD